MSDLEPVAEFQIRDSQFLIFMILGVLKENIMPKFHPIELRERVVAHVEDDHTHRASAERFIVSIGSHPIFLGI